ncbi:MAG: M48 family metallopeptidase [Bacteroidales bacterium]|jgi:predicted Zn-dependent protease|nr:M48 family metallopeptidase [Bacteroidales bacterium]
MKKIIAILSLVVIMISCGVAPVTGRKQFFLVSDSEVMTLSLQSYTEYMATAKKSSDMEKTKLVYKVGLNLAEAVEKYYQQHPNISKPTFDWEFNLVEDAQVNAFCMPGGKIVVYTGILPFTQDETGLAVVLGHEVGHAMAKHSNERMSQQVMINGGGQILGSVLNTYTSQQISTLSQQVYGLGAQYGVTLPFSRKQELEADEIGLTLMAMAAYDPSKATAFWQRMAAQGTKQMEFLSTHPSDAHRIKNINEHLAAAQAIYSAGPKKPNNPSFTLPTGNTNTGSGSGSSGRPVIK